MGVATKQQSHAVSLSILTIISSSGSNSSTKLNYTNTLLNRIRQLVGDITQDDHPMINIITWFTPNIRKYRQGKKKLCKMS